MRGGGDARVRRLFSHIVRRVNELLDGPRGKIVGALDIFGFEIFEVNSFEQLCINFANEKLQQLFCLHTFKEEEKLYEAEGIEHDHVAFIDNQPVLSLIEGRPTGVLMVLDDEAFIGPKGSDEGFLNNVKQLHDKSELLHVFTLQDRRRARRPASRSSTTRAPSRTTRAASSRRTRTPSPPSCRTCS